MLPDPDRSPIDSREAAGEKSSASPRSNAPRPESDPDATRLPPHQPQTPGQPHTANQNQASENGDAETLGPADTVMPQETFIPESAIDDDSTRIESSIDTQWQNADPLATFTPADGRPTSGKPVRYDALDPGDQIGEFRIQRLLGRGSFGAVYLARDLTLDRLVAVKVVLPEGQRATAGEGRSLARLRHPNIVGVYGEAYNQASKCLLLWMQFVDGFNLATVIERLYADVNSKPQTASQPTIRWDEHDLQRAAAGDQDTASAEQPSAEQPPAEQPSSEQPMREASPRRLRARGSLELVCRIGVQLAQAISHAHRSGVTHRDIKPANILIQRDGTPLLADFNLAENSRDSDREATTGGTIAYMPPEQFAQVLGDQDSIDARRADVYSLGLVLWELACGSRPHAEEESRVHSSGIVRLREFLKLRRVEVAAGQSDIPIGLQMVLRRAIAVDPERRYPSAKAMATALRGLEELERARRRAPTVDRLRQFIRVNLLWIILIGGVLPHLAASVFQSAYNYIWIQPDDQAFARAFIAYNLVVYPACVGWLAWNVYKFASGYRRVAAREPFPRGQLRKLRGRLLRLPRQFMIASAIGWFPGIVLFPWLLGQFGSPPSAGDWFHYGVSFTTAGLIATTYSYAFVLFVVVCHGYRACWQTASHYRLRARAELSGLETRIRWVSILAGVLPLAGAVLLLAIGLEDLTFDGSMEMSKMQQHMDQMKRHMRQMDLRDYLVTAMIVLGAIGLYVVETARERLIRCVRALTLADD